MPTALPRIQVTQTPPVARALEIAAREWPGVPRSEQIARLLTAGAETVAEADVARRRTRRRALEEMQGKYADAYPANYLEELRQDWPQ